MDHHLNRKAMYPHQIVERVAEFLKEGDLEGIITMYHPDCMICFPPDQPPKQGHAGVREVFADFVKIQPTLISTVKGEIINGDTALLQGEWHFKDQDGAIFAQGTSTEIAKRLEYGGWVYWIDCPLGAPTPISLNGVDPDEISSVND